jgi:type I restriction enzyme M protein
METNDSYVALAIRDGHLRLEGETPKRLITYLAVNQTERYDDPEEQVRAEYWAELVYRYGYELDHIGVEVIVPDRTPRDAADLVIFHDPERKRPFAVIECKQDGITDAEFNQAVEQACGNGTWTKLRAKYVGVVAGATRRFLDFSDDYGVLERETNIIADLPSSYGKPAEFKYRKGGPLDIAPVSRQELILAIRKSHQTLWGGGKLSPPSAFGELAKLIFVKISDETAKRKKGDPYDFQIKTHESSRSLAERVRGLYEIHQRRDPNVFTEPIRIGDSQIRSIVSHLEAIDLTNTDLDTKGVAFEQFMDGFFKGDFGQYFTPRPIIEFAVRMTSPTNDDRVIDPACGSAGFLLHALDAVRAEADEYYDEDPKEHYRHWHDFAQTKLFGIEINDEIARVAKMNMIVHDDGHSNIVGADALDYFNRLSEINRGIRPGTFDLVLTNPPFGSTIALADHPYLAEFDLGNKSGSGGGQGVRATQKTEILFLERIADLLVPGTGRAAVVVPDGILSNASLQYVRDYMLSRFRLQAVISLPATAFFHYGAGVKSSLIFLRRRDENEVADTDELVFMAAPELIGYDATGRETANQLGDVVDKYKAFQLDPESFRP